ncbi:MFS transporter [Nocardioides sp. zg-1308]|uniref:MFS transporter n=1 Tax=Nocardioides sp. zg-1308 TaxID=2736253 RepID=UPI0015580F64|nr:MFS transporter [Nocardioides sp. zg-1308]
MNPARARHPRHVERLVLVAGSASLLDSAAIISVGSALPLWRSQLRLDDVEVGVVSATMTIAIALGALAGGWLADRLGRRRVFTATVALYAFGAALVALAGSRTGLVAGVAVLGLGSGADLPASIALVAGRVPARLRGRMVAATHVMWTVGIVLASAAAFAVSPFGLPGMRAVFGALALGALATLAARRRAVPPDLDPDLGPDPGAAAGPRTGAGEVAAAPVARGDVRVLVAVALFYLLYTLVANTFGSFRTYLLVTVGDASQAGATAISFGMTLVGLVGTVAFSAIADSRWRRTVYPFAAVALVCSQAMLSLTVGQSLSATVAALVLYALAYPYVGEGLYKVWAQESVSPAARATFQGATIAGARAAAALFALVTPSLLADDPAVLFWLLTVIAAAAVLVGRRSRERPSAGPAARSTRGVPTP